MIVVYVYIGLDSVVSKIIPMWLVVVVEEEVFDK